MSTALPDTLTIARPDDCHLHLRDGALLADVVADSAARFARAVVMPNLDPPVTTVAAALAYRRRIVAACPRGSDFEPLMTLYLTPDTTVEEIRRAAETPEVVAVKLYPAGATTGSAHGVRALDGLAPVFDAMQNLGVPLLVHAESVDPEVDVFDREAVFIERSLAGLVDRFAGLRVVLEHASTRVAVEFVAAAPAHVAATLTAHHLLLNRNHLLAGGIRPHHYCAPILKRERDRMALVAAAVSGDASFFLGTDSAPHPRGGKESACGCAGIYTAHAAIEFYAEVFAHAGALERLEAFAAHHGADFYGLPRNRATLTLARRERAVAPVLACGHDELVPMRAGGHTEWELLA